MAGQPPFAVHISLTVNPESVYWDLAERLLITAIPSSKIYADTTPLSLFPWSREYK